MTRESFARKYLKEVNGKDFLLRNSSNVRIIAIHNKCILLGNQIMVEPGDTIITIFRNSINIIVSVSKYTGTLQEYFSEVLPYKSSITDADIIRRIYSDMETPNICEG